MFTSITVLALVIAATSGCLGVSRQQRRETSPPSGEVAELTDRTVEPNLHEETGAEEANLVTRAATWNALVLPAGWQLQNVDDREFTLISTSGSTAYVRVSSDDQQLLWSVVYFENDTLCTMSSSEQFNGALPERLIAEPDSYSSANCESCPAMQMVTVNWPLQERFFTDFHGWLANPTGGHCVPYGD